MPPNVLRITDQAVQALNDDLSVRSELRFDPATAGVSFGPNGGVTVDATDGRIVAGRVSGLDRSRVAADGDAITVSYFRECARYKAPVHACAASSVPLSLLIDGAVVDDVTLSVGQRVLLTAQTNAVENGIYDVAATGSPGPARSSDMPVGCNAFGMMVYVLESGDAPSGTRRAQTPSL